MIDRIIRCTLAISTSSNFDNIYVGLVTVQTGMITSLIATLDLILFLTDVSLQSMARNKELMFITANWNVSNATFISDDLLRNMTGISSSISLCASSIQTLSWAVSTPDEAGNLGQSCRIWPPFSQTKPCTRWTLPRSWIRRQTRLTVQLIYIVFPIFVKRLSVKGFIYPTGVRALAFYPLFLSPLVHSSYYGEGCILMSSQAPAVRFNKNAPSEILVQVESHQTMDVQ